MHTRSHCWCLPRATFGLASISFVWGVIGCSSDIPTYPVRGRVTFEGKALPGGGSIRFVPLSAKGKEAGGSIAADGTFQMQTYGSNDGAIVGEHRVEIFQNRIVKQAVYPEVKLDGDKEPGPVEAISPEVRIAPQEEISSAYGGPDSPLKATVKAIKSNESNFDLQRIP